MKLFHELTSFRIRIKFYTLNLYIYLMKTINLTV